MGKLLHKLGAATYRHRRAVVAVWLVILLTVGALAATFMGKLSNTFTLPGTETERVLEVMSRELPELSAGTGSVVFVTEDGEPFTDAQQSAIEDAITQIQSFSFVSSVVNPFETQAELDSSAQQIADGEEEIAANQEKLATGEAQIKDGKAQLETAKAQLEAGQKEIEANEPTLVEGRAQLEAARTQLEEAAAQLASGKEELDQGWAQLESGRQQLAEGEAEYAASKAQIEQGEAQLAAGKAELDKQASALEAGQAEFDAGVAALTSALSAIPGVDQVNSLSGVPTAIQQAEPAKQAAEQLLTQYDQLTAQREQLEAQLAALDPQSETYQQDKATLEATIQQVDNALARLEAAVQQQGTSIDQMRQLVSGLDSAEANYQKLVESQEQLQAGQTAIAAGRKEIAANEAKLATAREQLAAGRTQLDQAASQITAGEAELAAGQAEYDSGLAEYQAGRAEFEANEKTLEEGEAALAEGKKQIEEGQKQIEENEAKLAAAEAELAEGREQLEAGTAELQRGARLAALSENISFVSADGDAAIAQISFTGQVNALKESERQQLYDAVADLPGVGVEALYSQEITSDLNSILGVSEVIGFLIAAVVLLFVLGTVVAAGLPLLVALFGVAIGVGSTLALSSTIDMQSITPVLALMLGLAVGIDYSLFIVHRHRTQMLAGMPTEESVARAIATSGSAVVFAGTTVVIALSALVVPGLPFLSVLGLSAAFTVLIVVLLSITLTPALLGFMGEKVLTKKGRAQRAEAQQAIAAGHAAGSEEDAMATAESEHKASTWWAKQVTRHAWAAAGVVVLILGVLAIPAASMQTALPDGGSEPEGSDAQRSFEIISEEFGEGFNGPLLIMAELPAGLTQDEADDALLDLAEELSAFDGVQAAIPVTTNDALTYGALQVVPTTGPSSPDTEALVHQIRDARSQLLQDTNLETSVTGMVAAQIDISEMISAALAPYLTIVVGLSLVLLLLVFRSLAIPIIATVGFLLSLAAAFGVTVAVYQWGWLGGLFAVYNPGPVLSFLPILLTGILFGLAMDYQVFIVTSMKEAYDKTGRPTRSVRTGFSMAAPVVVAAALIMISVFAGFIFSHLAMIRPLGFALAMGVLFDAFFVRMTFVPAVLTLLGKRAWYLPKWLQRILPKVDVEGASVE